MVPPSRTSKHAPNRLQKPFTKPMKHKSKQVVHAARSEGLSLQLEDDVPDFPRGGASLLSSGERDKVRSEVNSEDGRTVVLKNKKKNERRGKKVGASTDDDAGSLFGGGITGKLPRYANRITLKLMPHGGYGKRTFDGRKPTGGNAHQQSKGLGFDKMSKPKPRSASFKNQIRSVERLLQKDIPLEVREVQTKKLEELKKQQDTHNQLSVDIEQKKKKLSGDKKIFLRYKMVKFFERRKIDRRIKRLEKSQLDSSDPSHETMIAEQLVSLKEDLEYVRFFPKTEKYVSLFMGGDDPLIVEKRNRLREQIKANIAAAASGKNLEETGGGDDGILDVSDDDFFLNGSSSDEADPDDELKTKSTREQAPNASRKPEASGLSSGKRNHKEVSAQAVMPPTRPASSSFSNSARAGKPPPRPTSSSFSNSAHGKSNFGGFSSKKPVVHRADFSAPGYTSNSRNGSSFGNRAAASEFSIPSYTSNSRNGPSFGNRAAASEFSAPGYTSNSRNRPSFGNRAAASDVRAVGLSSNVSSSSEVRKPKRKRRAKKKKQEN